MPTTKTAARRLKVSPFNYLSASLSQGILASAQGSLDDAVCLKECQSLDLSRIASPADYIAAAGSSETLENIEEIVTAWIKQIEQVGAATSFPGSWGREMKEPGNEAGGCWS